MVLNTRLAKCSTVSSMRHPKIMSFAVMLVIFGGVGGIAWAIVNSHAHVAFATSGQMQHNPATDIAENCSMEALPFKSVNYALSLVSLRQENSADCGGDRCIFAHQSSL